MKRYYKCSVETSDAYKSAGFIVKDNGPVEDKLVKFFESWNMKYDGVYLPLTECEKADLKELNYIFKESIFGRFFQVK